MSVGTRTWGHRYPTHFATSTFNSVRKVARAHVALTAECARRGKDVRERTVVAVSWLGTKKRAGSLRVFPPAAGPQQTARPSLVQRLSVCLLHTGRRPPAATHAAIWSGHVLPALPREQVRFSDLWIASRVGGRGR